MGKSIGKESSRGSPQIIPGPFDWWNFDSLALADCLYQRNLASKSCVFYDD